MKFDDFLLKVPQIKDYVLDPKRSHTKMEPRERAEFMKSFETKNLVPKNAGVMMLFYPRNNQTHFVLIERTSYNGVHSSQMAFPGGKFETFDADFLATAHRETHEEIGISPEKISFAKAFTPLYVPPSNFMVYPFLGFSTSELTFIPDSREVASIAEIPVSMLIKDENQIQKNLNTSYMKDTLVSGFLLNNHFVWGATAMMLSELKDVLKNVL
jgi:8-oxo-dGTP pyrophosphatase MutT (NUDIX family)